MISDLEKMYLFVEGNWDPIEKIIREEIASEIEKIEPRTNIDDIKAGYVMARNYAVAIARGTNDK
jgi:hypothetical protein